VRPAVSILSHPPQVRDVTHVRSTLIQSSLTSLRSCGHFERYVKLLDRDHAQLIVDTMAPVWLPVVTGMAHYRACDAMSLSEVELLSMGEAVGDRIQVAFLRTLSQSVKAVGFTPWSLLSHFGRLWQRLFLEGSIAVTQVGPKDGSIDVAGLPLVEFAYFREAMRGVLTMAIKFAGARTALVRVSQFDAARGSIVIHASWV
jgi:hypothetical protein